MILNLFVQKDKGDGLVKFVKKKVKEMWREMVIWMFNGLSIYYVSFCLIYGLFVLYYIFIFNQKNVLYLCNLFLKFLNDNFFYGVMLFIKKFLDLNSLVVKFFK